MQPHTRLKPSTRRPILPANSVSHLQAKRDMPGPPDCQTPSFPSTSFTSSTYPTDPSKGRFSSSTPLFVPRFSTRVLFIQSQRRVSRFWSPPIWEGPPPPGRLRAAPGRGQTQRLRRCRHLSVHGRGGVGAHRGMLIHWADDSCCSASAEHSELRRRTQGKSYGATLESMVNHSKLEELSQSMSGGVVYQESTVYITWELSIRPSQA